MGTCQRYCLYPQGFLRDVSFLNSCIFYTDDCRSRHDNRFIVFKFADDSAIVSLLCAEENDHGPVVDDFIQWCDSEFLQVNVFKM